MDMSLSMSFINITKYHTKRDMGKVKKKKKSAVYRSSYLEHNLSRAVAVLIK